MNPLQPGLPINPSAVSVESKPQIVASTRQRKARTQVVAEARFGNDAAKIERYRAFWRREGVERPLVGFTLRGWLPLNEYAASRAWKTGEYLAPSLIEPEAFLDDEERLLREGEVIDDDIIRGASPTSAVVFWLAAILGSRLRILPGNVLPEDRSLPWDKLEQLHLDHDNPWFRKYLACADALAQRARGRFPVSHSALLGPSDLMAALRGHTQSIVDLMEEPLRSSRLLWALAEVFAKITEELWKRLPRFRGGYFDAMYQLWSPGPIIRMQEDASALYSPALYRKLLQPIDRHLAGRFESSFMHLHSTSMFILDAILEIEELGCVEINNDVSGPALDDMVPYFKMVQSAERSLLIRGSFTPDEIRLLMDSLEPRGLYLLIIVANPDEAAILKPLLGM